METFYFVPVPVVGTDANPLFQSMFHTSVFCLSILAWVDYFQWSSYPLDPERRQIIDEIVAMAPTPPTFHGFVWVLFAYVWCHCRFIRLPSFMKTHTFTRTPPRSKFLPNELLVVQAEYWAGIIMLILILQLQIFLWWTRAALITEELGNADDKAFGTLHPQIQLLVRRALSLFVHWALLSTYGVFFAVANEVHRIIRLVLGSVVSTILLLPLFVFILVVAFLL
ncbi:hypothetical protein Daesc_004734 [Daldinia eschscholtzii]|uniref:Uncharacterized protein n=1 Tax=Daldinia eschscholtzii TaxID=292717 RepID=A0AAX6MQ53_9PEZI